MELLLVCAEPLDDRDRYNEAENMSTRHQWPPRGGIGVDASY